MVNLEKLLEPFGLTFGQLQDTITLLKHLEKNNVSIESFIDYVEEKKLEKVNIDKQSRKQFKKSKELWNKNALKCSDCGEVMMLFDVNTRPKNQVGGGFNSMWYCRKCYHAQYNEQTVEEVLKGLNWQ